MPVFVVYHVGVLFLDVRNGADLLTRAMLELIESSPLAYVALTLSIAGGFVWAARSLRPTAKLSTRTLRDVWIESVVLALLMALVVGWATAHIVSNASLAPLTLATQAMSPFARFIMAAGAGLHEELVFRVLLFGGSVRALQALGRAGWPIELGCALVAAFLFSAIHYVGSFGDPLELGSFVFRWLSGLYLTAVYRFRGFAVAVYTHMLYDLFVFFLW